MGALIADITRTRTFRWYGVAFIDRSQIGFVLTSTNMQWCIALFSKAEPQDIGLSRLRLIHLDEIR